MVCLGPEPGAVGWKAQTNPLSYSGIPYSVDWVKEYYDIDETDSGTGADGINKFHLSVPNYSILK